MWGRDFELNKLADVFRRTKSSFVVIRGRRRLGKSTMLRHFGKQNAKSFYEFSGLPPSKNQTNQDQLNEFLLQLRSQLPTRKISFNDWTEAFAELAFLLKRRSHCVILLDEISWMGQHDDNFAGKLKNAWDRYFSLQNQSMLAICGSVSVWIQENILNSTNFVGRISLSIDLKELPIKVTPKFWGQHQSRTSKSEIIKALAITGCIPKYLEEIQHFKSLKESIHETCFRSSGFFYNEFNSVFSDILGKESPTYRKILLNLIEKKKTATQLARLTQMSLSGSFLKNLSNLELSGFIDKDYSFQIAETISGTSHYRLKDNFSRFSLKYIEPSKQRLSKLENSFRGLDFLPSWNSILGLQFENLVLNHLSETLEALNISTTDILSASPHSQKKKTRNKGGCQIDLLIQTLDQVAYICELKCQQEIDKSIIKEVNTKLIRIEKKRNWSYRPILIYEGELKPNDVTEIKQFFSKTFRMSDLFEI